MKTKNLVNLPLGKNPPKIINAIVEIPKGSRNKYEYDKERCAFRLDRVLYASVHYPANYGFIPSTSSTDGDPLDILILVNEPAFVGVLIDVCPIGVFYMKDEGGEDEKIISVPFRDPYYASMKNISDLPRHFTIEVNHFFSIYKELEGKQVITFGYKGVEEAEKVIMNGHKLYIKKEGLSL
jgi:inorganic pyrophosphatase